MTSAQEPARSSLPWSRDRAFWSITATQFLGAFNDNVFKQLLLLLCIDMAHGDPSRDQQWLVQILFSAPFILFSGFAGYLSDRFSKSRIVLLCKIAEIGIALAGMAALGVASLSSAMFVVCLMGTHSAFFGPPKYGILPELFQEHDLPRVNGVIAMTTFLAVILAFPTAGALKIAVQGELWHASIACVALAILGTGTALLLRRTPPTAPGLEFQPSSLFVDQKTWASVKANPGLLKALIASSVFWMTGGVVYPLVINAVGRMQFGLDDYQTGLLASCTGLGITVGCVIAGALSKNSFRAGILRLGMWGMLASLVVLAIPGSGLIEREISAGVASKFSSSPPAEGEAEPGSGTVKRSFRPVLIGLTGSRLVLGLLGISAGLFSVPVQVYLQARAPQGQKGRVIGIMNLFNWIGIAGAGLYHGVANSLLAGYQAPNLVFAAAGLAVIPLLVWYRPRDEVLQ